MLNRFPISAALTLPLLALGPAHGATIRATYLTEARAELAEQAALHPALMDAQAVARLPDPLRRYFERCGFLGRPAMRTARLSWAKFEMKRGKGKGWMPVEVRQINLVAEPARFVYLHARIAGILPFNGLDQYQGGHGRMLIRAMGLFKIADARSPHMDASAMVTFLAELPFHPSAALQPYLRWEPIDSLSALAVFTHAGRSVSGTFRFNAEGEFIAFASNDRWQDGHEGGPIPWSISAGEYRDMGGFRLPTRLTATWHEKDGDLEYFRGRLAKAEYDVEEP
jgi:hypothetical protein